MAFDVGGRGDVPSRVNAFSKNQQSRDNTHSVLKINPDGILIYANKHAGNILSDWRLTVNKKLPDDLIKKYPDISQQNQSGEIFLNYLGKSYTFYTIPFKEDGYTGFYGINKEQESTTAGKFKAGFTYQSAAESNISDEFTAVISASGRIEFASQSCHKLTGFNPADLAGNNIARFVHPQDLKLITRRPVDQLAETFGCRLRILNSNGDHVWFDMLVTITRDTYRQLIRDIYLQGKPCSGAGEVITTMKEQWIKIRMLKKLSERLTYAKSVNEIGDLVCTMMENVFTDSKINFIKVDEEGVFSRIASHNKSENHVGENFLFLPWTPETLNPKTEVWNTLDGHNIPDLLMEDLIKNECRHCIFIPFRGEEAGDFGLAVYGSNEFVRNNATESVLSMLKEYVSGALTRVIIGNKLNQTEANFQDIIETLNDAYIRTDAEGNMLLSNPVLENILGYKQEDVFNKSLSMLWSDQSEYQMILIGIKSDKSIFEKNITLKSKDGSHAVLTTRLKGIFSTEDIFMGLEVLLRHAKPETKQNLIMTAVFETDPRSVLIFDAGLKINRVNRSCRIQLERFMNFTVHNGDVVSDLVKNLNLKSFYSSLKIAKIGKSVKFNESIRTTSGTMHNVEFMVVPSINSNGVYQEFALITIQIRKCLP